jgi:hypothetical protein
LGKYTSYAVGELLLVIVGILVALQIDNWNENREQQANLEAYLETIARNMQEDQRELAVLREQRNRHLEAGILQQYFLNQSEYSQEDIFVAYQGLVTANAELFFSANTSGYDTLKTSDVLGRLQGTGIDVLLSAYYDKVGRIELLERSHAEYVRFANFERMRKSSGRIEGFAFSNPSALTPQRFSELQPVYREVIQGPIWNSLIYTQGRVQRLIQLYDSLGPYADALIVALAGGELGKISTVPATTLDRLGAGKGLPVLIANGVVALENYWLAGISSPGSEAFGAGSFRFADGELQLRHDGQAEWASVYMGLERVDAAKAGRLGLDFSAFTTLEVEMKGSKGGETLQVAIKDADYPDWKAPVGVSLTLEKNWRRYEIPLTAFAPNDLTRINVPLAFNFAPATEPTEFSVRSARYQ